MTEVLLAGRRRRRFHTRAFKAMIVESCYVEGVSLSSVAISHGLNPNMVRRWVAEFESGAVDLPIPNKQRLLELIAAGHGHTEHLRETLPSGVCTPAPSVSLGEEAPSLPSEEQSVNDHAAADSAQISEFLPIKVQPSSSAPCRVEIQVRKMDAGHSLHIALASATVNDCLVLLREFLQ